MATKESEKNYVLPDLPPEVRAALIKICANLRPETSAPHQHMWSEYTVHSFTLARLENVPERGYECAIYGVQCSHKPFF